MLGVAPGTREVGLAVAMPGHLLDIQVKDFHRVVSREQKAARFQRAVERWIERDGVTGIALVAPAASARSAAVLDQLALLRAEAAARRIPLVEVGRHALRADLAPGRFPSNRRLAEALAHEFPELRRVAPSSEPVPGADRVPELALRGHRTRTNRQRYWARAFLALAAARQELRRLSNIEP